jgi:hypothetical protein
VIASIAGFYLPSDRVNVRVVLILTLSQLEVGTGIFKWRKQGVFAFYS